MKGLMNKIFVITIAILFILSMTVSISVLPSANAHNPPWNIPNWLYLTVEPNPIGVGQPLSIVIWDDLIPPTAGGSGGDRWTFTVDVTSPSGSSKTLGPFASDDVGSVGTSFTPDQTGNWTFQAFFPGKTLTNYNPVTGQISAVTPVSPYVGDYYEPSNSTVVSVTVQQNSIPLPPTYPLPTDYWSRPIEGQNSAWYTIASNWLGAPQIYASGAEAKVQSDGSAPNTPHILWTKPIEFGGLVGGNGTYNIGAPDITYYSGPQYELKFSNPMIIQGNLYYSQPLSDAGTGAGVVDVNLQTGQQVWWQNYTSFSYAQLYDYESGNQHGIITNGYLISASGTTWNFYDPMTGDWLFKIINVPSGTMVYGSDGSLDIYTINNAGHYMTMWNDTAAPGETGGTSGTNQWQWRPIGQTIDGSTAYQWNVSIPDLTGMTLSGPNTGNPSIIRVVPGEFIFGQSSALQQEGSTASTTQMSGTPNPYTFWQISLQPGSVGSLLWKKSYTAPADNETMLYGPVDEASDGSWVFTMCSRETMQWTGYSLANGGQLWGPTAPMTTWDFWTGTSGGITTISSAYGNLYAAGYGGLLYCYDLKTGNTLWTYGNGDTGNSTNSGFSTPYGVYPIQFNAIADGMVFLSTSEHSPNAPLYEGSLERCINATTGKEIWTLFGSTHSGEAAVADGMLTYLNLYDMQIYTIGKGSSETTVETPLAGIAGGQSFTIQGKVMDTSAGTKQTEQAADFPQGVPCVSDASQGAWMEYVYMQKPAPTNTIGVPVSIDVIDPNGNSVHLGDVTSDSNGFYTFQVNPSMLSAGPGTYKVIASFAGSNSYWGSNSESSVTINPVPTNTQTATPIAFATTADLMTYTVAAAIAIIVAVAIVGIGIVFTLRRRP